MVALREAGYTVENHPLAHTLGVEYIIRAQQNDAITQENISEVIKSFKSEAGCLTTLITKYCFPAPSPCNGEMSQHVGQQAATPTHFKTFGFLESFKLAS